MILALLLLITAPADTFTGKVVGVKDGDSIVVLRGDVQIEIRLQGIDCPEFGQAFGQQAKKRNSDLCFGKTVTVQTMGRDRYGRTLADVNLPDGRNLNRELVRSGHAWWFRKYSDDQNLQRLEGEAKKHKLGLWTDPKPVPPWEWRAAQRNKSAVPASGIKLVPNGIAIVALLPNPHGPDAGNEQVTIANSSGQAVDLGGWKLVDKAGNVYLLSGTAKLGNPLVVTMTDATMPLNNDGDTVLLIDSGGVGRSQVSYTGSQVRAGIEVKFGR